MFNPANEMMTHIWAVEEHVGGMGWDQQPDAYRVHAIGWCREKHSEAPAILVFKPGYLGLGTHPNEWINNKKNPNCCKLDLNMTTIRM